MPEWEACRPAPGIRWAVESRGILLLQGSGTTRLGYPEAALWDFFSRAMPWSRAVRLFAASARMEAPEAERLASRTLAAWLESGLIEEVRAGG